MIPASGQNRKPQVSKVSFCSRQIRLIAEFKPGADLGLRQRCEA